MRLALKGGKPAIEGTLARFNTIGKEEIVAATSAMRAGPLSGYLGGELTGGLRVEALEYEFAGAIGSKHAVAVNSATSGLLIACMAAGIKTGDDVITTPFTMSATAAAPAFLGANIRFGDIEDKTFCLRHVALEKPQNCKAVIITNLFGHPADLKIWRDTCDMCGHVLIEDNAQAPFASEYAHFTGTIGHMGVFSLNVHKHLQSGEGGIVVTNDDKLAHDLRLLRNHSELAAMGCGLNLRMTEVTAAIALAQLAKREKIISERIEIAETLTDMVKDLPGLTPPVVRDGCRHVYYCLALTIDDFPLGDNRLVEGDFSPGDKRDWFVEAMQAEGVPLRRGYVRPLYHLPAFEQYRSECPVAEHAHKTIALYENCAYTPTASQLRQFKTAFEKVIDGMPAGMRV
jgi:perosamine synthetase